MASKASPSPSRLPLPVRTTPIESGYTHTKSVGEGDHSSSFSQSSSSHKAQNGLKTKTQCDEDNSNHEILFMREGSSIPTPLSISQAGNQLNGSHNEINYRDVHIGNGTHLDAKQSRNTSKIARFVRNPSPQPSSCKSQMAAATSSQVTEFPFVQAPVAEIEELSDLSQSSCSESDFGNGVVNTSSSLPSNHTPLSPDGSHSPNIVDTPTSCDESVEPLGSKTQSILTESNSCPGGPGETSFSEPPSSGDSGFVHDGHASDSEHAENESSSDYTTEHILTREGGYTSDETLTGRRGLSDNSLSNSDSAGEHLNQAMVTSKSGEKFGVNSVNLVRTSKSHENYLQAGTGLAVVNIDIEDNLANSLDALTYHDSPNSSVDNVTSDTFHISRSLENSPERKVDKSNGEILPAFRNLEDTKIGKRKMVSDGINSDHLILMEANNSGNSCCANNASDVYRYNKDEFDGESGGEAKLHVGEIPSGDSLNLSVLSDESDSDSLYHQPSKGVDRPSAIRLAKRLFHLEGFRKSDVSRHLSKKNDFSNLVAEEYLKHFAFQDDTLDSALRKFLQQFSLYGETQERERVLAHFSHRFMECNPGSFNSEDACHTLTCAIMLLNTDLHAPNVNRRMTCQEFIENLTELNDGENFPKEVLKAIYQAIKNEPIEWAVDQSSSDGEGMMGNDQSQLSQSQLPPSVGSNPFLEVPDPSKTTEYKRGYVMRKCCMEPDRRKTPFGKRSWKMLYAVLRDMIIYQYKDEHQLKKGQFVENSQNAIRIHHALATKATDYTKKQHVFRLQTADWAEYLFQTGDSKELQEWVDSINLVAASLSAPPLPGAVGSRTKFQRQLLPSTYTRLNLREQLQSHRAKIVELEQELHNHRAEAPEKGAKSSICQDYIDKELYLEYELKRFKIYVFLLNSKLSQFPDASALEAGSLVETAIGESDEFGGVGALTGALATVDLTQIAVTVPPPHAAGQPAQPSLSDSNTSNEGLMVAENVHENVEDNHNDEEDQHNDENNHVMQNDEVNHDGDETEDMETALWRAAGVNSITEMTKL